LLTHFIYQHFEVNDGGEGGEIVIRLTFVRSVKIIFVSIPKSLPLTHAVASSSSEANELRSELDGDDDLWAKFSCSCIIARNS
jgi:hypothetical protein